jgi:hypothetical protein
MELASVIGIAVVAFAAPRISALPMARQIR